MKTIAPITLFVYNRPEHTRRTLESLMQNEFSQESDLIIFCDGPKKGSSEEQIKRIDDVRKIIREKRWCKNVTIKESVINKGLARSITDGVTEIINISGKVIVLEDDMETSRWFLKFMNESLDYYEKDDRVISITGFTWPVKDNLPESFFLTGTYCWGWATWKRGWEYFEPDGKKLLQELEQKKLTGSFDFGNSYHYTQMLRDQTTGNNDSWALRWYASAFLKNKLTLIPGRSLVQNTGFDGSGIHCMTSKDWEVVLSQTIVKVENIPVVDNTEARKSVRRFFISLKKHRSIYNRIINRVNIIFGNKQ